MKKIFTVALMAFALMVGVQNVSAVTFPGFLTVGDTVSSKGQPLIVLQTILEQTLDEDGRPLLVFPPYTYKGYFGELTKVALAKFQHKVGIIPDTGTDYGYFGRSSIRYFNTLDAQEPKIKIIKIHETNTGSGGSYFVQAGKPIKINWEASNLTKPVTNIKANITNVYWSVQKSIGSITPNASGTASGSFEFTGDETKDINVRLSPYFTVSFCGETTLGTGTATTSVCSGGFGIDFGSPGMIKVGYPNGGQTISAGDVININWHANARIKNFQITYQGERSGARTIEQNVTGGSYKWNVPMFLPNGKYKIGITAIDPGRGPVSDTSDNFFTIGTSTISAPSTAPVVVPKVIAPDSVTRTSITAPLPIVTTTVAPSAPSATFISPKGDDVSFSAGGRILVQGSVSNMSNDVKADVFLVDSKSETEYSPALVSNSYEFTKGIPVVIPTGTATGYYKIRVKFSLNGSVILTKDSSSFTVLARSVTKGMSKSQIANVIEAIRQLFSR
jgi:hypothetical protein